MKSKSLARVRHGQENKTGEQMKKINGMSEKTAQQLVTGELRKIAIECIDRQNRKTHPSGKTDNGGRWYPSEDEHCKCCDNVRSPSRAFPWSYMTHCRSIRHISNLHNVDEKALRWAVKCIKANG